VYRQPVPGTVTEEYRLPRALIPVRNPFAPTDTPTPRVPTESRNGPSPIDFRSDQPISFYSLLL